MNISVLSENTPISSNFACEHGLSLYIETKQHNIIFDTGASALFKDNAVTMGIDIAQADIAVISHGHYDHGGGLSELLKCNQQARIYISQFAFSDYRSMKASGETSYIGLDNQLAANQRLYYVKECCTIDDNTLIFSGVGGTYPRPAANASLYTCSDQHCVHDDFNHEQNLILFEAGNMILIAGCAHSGIVNIIEHCRQLTGAYPSTVIGGFHLYNGHTNTTEDSANVAALAEYFLQTGASYYTGHCTGSQAYQQLHAIMGGRIDTLAAGKQIELT